MVAVPSFETPAADLSEFAWVVRSQVAASEIKMLEASTHESEYLQPIASDTMPPRPPTSKYRWNIVLELLVDCGMNGLREWKDNIMPDVRKQMDTRTYTLLDSSDTDQLCESSDQQTRGVR